MRIFDKLNTPSESKIIPIEQYFDEMELTEAQKDKRKEFAESMEEVMLFIFALFLTMKEYNYINKKYIIQQLEIRYSGIVSKYVDIDRYLEDYITEFSTDTVETTIKNGDTAYFTSGDRAILIAENESHFTFSRNEYYEAIKAGKIKKQWMDIRDKKERKTHREVGGMVLPIREPFVVGNSLMMYATDHSLNAEAKEIINCRCSTRYF